MKRRKLTKEEIDSAAWQPWIDQLEKWGVCITLDLVHPSVTDLVAAALSVAKWHPKRKMKDRGIGTCALCEVNSHVFCIGCPLKKVIGSCERNSFWSAKREVNRKTPGAACDRMYLELLAAYALEYEKHRDDIPKLTWLNQKGEEV